MTVSVQSLAIAYVGDNLSKVFSYPFRILDTSHLKVFLNGVLQMGGYTVAGVDAQGGGTITFAVAPAGGVVVLLTRQVTRDQLVDYLPFDPFPAETHERALDKLTMAAQEDAGTLQRAIRAAPEDGPANLVIPLVADRANLLLAFDAFGNVITVTPGQLISHSDLINLAADDHLQYLNRDGSRPMTGQLILVGPPSAALHAASKAYVDSLIGGAILTNVVSNATGDAQPTVHQAWNAQQTAAAFVRGPSEFIHYRWPSTSPNVYRYLGNEFGPVWTSTALEWPQTQGITEAPADSKTYGRNNVTWVELALEFQPRSEQDQPNGYPSLGPDGKIPASQFPAGVVSEETAIAYAVALG